MALSVLFMIDVIPPVVTSMFFASVSNEFKIYIYIFFIYSKNKKKMSQETKIKLFVQFLLF